MPTDRSSIMQPRYAVIVAGGQGLRMGTDIPKQFLLLAGRPVLMHTLGLFAHCERIVLALPQGQIAYWHELCEQYHFDLEHQVCAGGETRFHSVQHALEALGETSGLVAVHDGVRPLVSPAVIAACYEAASSYGAALPCLPVIDSLRQLEGDSSHAVPRRAYVAVQTPQTFELERLRAAYDLGYDECFTDDASVYEAAGLGCPHLVVGHAENIKITNPQDLATAEYLLGRR